MKKNYFNSKNILLSALLLICSSLNAQWTQIGSDIDGETAGDQSGGSISLSADGSIMAVGATNNAGNGASAGHVRIYSWNSASWVQLGNDIDGENAGDYSGISVSLSADGMTVAIGAAYNTNANGSGAGHVRVYQWDGVNWVQMGADINGEASYNFAGYASSLSADGSILAIGAYGNGDNGPYAGKVIIYSWNGANWIQLGADLVGSTIDNYFGQALSISDDGTKVAVGAPYNNQNGLYSGQVSVYHWDGMSWSQLGSDIYGATANESLGSSVSISGDGLTLATGAPVASSANGIYSGYVKVFNWNGLDWIQLGNEILGDATDNISGTSVSLNGDGSIVVIGATGDDENGIDAGNAKVFQWNGTVWVQLGDDINGEAPGDYSGVVSISSDGLRVAVGAVNNDGNGSEAGHVRVYFLCDIAMGIDTQVACNSYTWIDGLNYTSSNNSATFTIVGGASNGCDSIVQLNLTINNVSDISTTTTGITIAANNSGATYQWLDCDNSYSIISGATSQTFTPALNGNYAVQLLENGCVDTSACVGILSVGIIENNIGQEYKLFPNPTEGDFSIDLGESNESTSVQITDIFGKTIQSQSFINSQFLKLSINEPQGIYFIHIASKDTTTVIRLVKK